MKINNQVLQNHFKKLDSLDSGKDRAQVYHAIDHSIRVLSAEILRLSKMSYASWGNMSRIKSLDDQIRYLEELLAAYEQDGKKY